jgi:hypothetical protein
MNKESRKAGNPDFGFSCLPAFLIISLLWRFEAKPR